jgi:hypothetical protein
VSLSNLSVSLFNMQGGGDRGKVEERCKEGCMPGPTKNYLA